MYSANKLFDFTFDCIYDFDFICGLIVFKSSDLVATTALNSELKLEKKSAKFDFTGETGPLHRLCCYVLTNINII